MQFGAGGCVLELGKERSRTVVILGYITTTCISWDSWWMGNGLLLVPALEIVQTLKYSFL